MTWLISIASAIVIGVIVESCKKGDFKDFFHKKRGEFSTSKTGIPGGSNQRRSADRRCRLIEPSVTDRETARRTDEQTDNETRFKFAHLKVNSKINCAHYRKLASLRKTSKSPKE